VHRCPANFQEILVGLQNVFSTDSLLETGLLQHDAEQVVPNLALRDGAWLQAHRDPQLESFCGISMAGGLLTAEGRSRADSIGIAVGRELSLEAAPKLLIVDNLDDDLALLDSWGYIVRANDALAAENAIELEEICMYLGWHAAEDVTEGFDFDEVLGANDLRGLELGEGNSESLSEMDGGYDYNLQVVVVAWSPSQLTRAVPEGSSNLISYLRQVQKVLGRNLSNVAVWRPTQAFIDALRFALMHATPTAVTSLLENSLRDECWSLDGFLPTPTVPPNYSEALAELQRLSTETINPMTWRPAVAALRQAQAQITAPLLVTGSDPLIQVQNTMIALMQDVHLSQYCELQRTLAATGSSEFPMKMVSSLVALSDRVSRLLKSRGD